jgi:hypothetical protein
MSATLLHGPAQMRVREQGALLPVALRRGFLVACAVFAPLCVPSGPGQTAVIDILNMAALCCGLVLMLVPGMRVRVPLLAPTLLVLFGSLLALLQAPAVKLGVLALAQDAYLFAWFVLLVNMVQSTEDVQLLARAWVAAAVVVALVALGQVVMHEGSLSGLLGARGLRPSGTLYNPNMLADYLVSSLFIATFALHRSGLLRRVLTFGALIAGLLATKSNGGMAALAAGLLVFALVRAAVRRTSPAAVGAVALLLASGLGLALWLHSEWGVGERAWATVQSHTFASRMNHSSESRMHIWTQLQRTYARAPLGIGPGNSGALTLGIADRERPDSFRSKEAHSDYLAYAIERGPLGLVGLAWMTIAGFVAVLAWAKATTDATDWKRDVAPAFAALLAASMMHSTVIEKLHFRHFWLALAMVCAAAWIAQRDVESREVAS